MGGIDGGANARIDEGLMGTLDVYAQNVHKASPTGNGGVQRRLALQFVEQMRAWSR